MKERPALPGSEHLGKSFYGFMKNHCERLRTRKFERKGCQINLSLDLENDLIDS